MRPVADAPGTGDAEDAIRLGGHVGDAFAGVLGDRLVALAAYGSSVDGSFIPGFSDLDLAFFIHGRVEVEDAVRVQRVLQDFEPDPFDYLHGGGAPLERSLARSGGSVTDEDRDIYRRPYPSRESRVPLLRWPRSMPVDGDPADVVARVEAYDRWLAASPSVPKLLLAFDPDGPGILMGRRLVDWCAANVAGLEIEECGFATHVVPEDRPEAIAAAIVAWADRHRLRNER